ATDTRTNRRVALKVLPGYFVGDAQRVLRFEQEARAVLALNHPNIVTIYEVGEAENTHFIATEFIEGETLRQRLSRESIPIPEVLEIAIQICDALVAANRFGIVHRDIKPENIMLRPDGYVKVLDFGIAKLDGPDIAIATGSTDQVPMMTTNPGMMMGTVRYMSPEQARGLEVDARTDIWSLGVVLYEMLTSRVPFSGETQADCAAAILETQPAPITRDNPTLPPELQWIINKTLRKDREERYQTARELLGDLRELKQELDLQSRLPGAPSLSPLVSLSPGHRIVGYVATHRLLVLGIVVALSLLMFGTWKYLPSRHRPINSLAVLPFINVSGEPNSEYVADGMTENLINSLSRLPSLKVIARNSVFRYKVNDPQAGVPDPQKVAHELGVQAVLIGRVIQHGDDLFVSAELVSAEDNSHIWGAQYNRKLSAVFAVEEQIARDISQELGSKLGSTERETPRRNPENLKAFEYYMQGRSFIHRRTREDLMTAGSYYQKAIEEDQNYALAYTGLAEVYGNLGVRGYIPPAEGREKLAEAARKAVALDDNLAEAHVMMGSYYTNFAPYNFADGDREFRRAIELSPSLAIAHLYQALSLFRQTRLDEGLNEMLKARELDPFSAIIARQVSLYYLLKREYPRALQILRQANELGPRFTTSNEIGIYVQNKLYDEALNALDTESRTRKDDPLLAYDRGMIYAAQGRRAEALKVIKDLEALSVNASQSLSIAKIYAALNEKDEVFNSLDRGLGKGMLGVFYPADPTWDNLRGDSRFPDLLRRLEIPQ
ncbi:MAG: protein kinase, partial [Acidobacteriota bacterium]